MALFTPGTHLLAQHANKNVHRSHKTQTDSFSLVVANMLGHTFLHKGPNN